MFANTFDDINIVPTFVLTPLTYLGGVFYSLELLPEFWATVSQANPLVYVVNAFRFGVLGVSDVSVGFAFGMIGVHRGGLLVRGAVRTGTRLRTIGMVGVLGRQLPHLIRTLLRFWSRFREWVEHRSALWMGRLASL